MPNPAAQVLRARTHGLIALQCAVGALVAAGFFLAAGRWDALSAVYGASIAIAMTLLLSRSISLAEKAESSQRSQLVLYAGAAVRFVLVLALFGFGLAGLGLAPLATVVGFIAVQLALPLSAFMRRDGRK